MSIERYELKHGIYGPSLSTSKNGEWVKYQDHLEALVEAYKDKAPKPFEETTRNDWGLGGW